MKIIDKFKNLSKGWKIVIIVSVSTLVLGIISDALTAINNKTCYIKVRKELTKQGYTEIPNNMHDAIEQHNFAAARMLKNCEYNKKYIPEELTMAEVSYKISNGAYDAALATAREDNRLDIFSKMYVDVINKMIEEDQFEKIMPALNSWVFSNSPSGTKLESKESVYGSGYEYEWERYNTEAGLYNTLVEKYMNMCIMKNEYELAKKCIALYAPLTQRNKDNKLVQVNTTRDRMIQKLKDLKIE